MRTLNYSLIGSMPELEMFRDTLPALIEAYEAPQVNFNEDGSDARMKRVADGFLIEMCAEHFYGFVLEDFTNMPELIEAIKAVDQELEVR